MFGFRTIVSYLKQLLNNQLIIMSQLTDLDSAILALKTEAKNAGDRVTASINDLTAKLAAAQNAGTTPDLSKEIADIQATAASLSQIDPTPTPAAPPVSPEPAPVAEPAPAAAQ